MRRTRLRLPDEPFTLAGNAAAAFGERLAACRLPPAAVSIAKRCRTRCRWRSPGCARCVPAATVAADQAAPEYVRNKVAQTTAERMDARAAKSRCRCRKQPTPISAAPVVQATEPLR